MKRQDDSTSHPDEVTYTTVVSAFVKFGLMDRARQVLAEMARMGVPANRITYNVLLKGYCKQLQIDKVEDLLREMVEDAGIEPDVVSYNIIIDGCILIDDSAGALSFFNEMRMRGIAPTNISYTTLMKAADLQDYHCPTLNPLFWQWNCPQESSFQHFILEPGLPKFKAFN